MATTQAQGRTRAHGAKPGRKLSAAAVKPAAGLPKHCTLAIDGDQGTIKVIVNRSTLANVLWDALHEEGRLRLSIKLEVEVVEELQAALTKLGLPSPQEV